MKLIFIKMPDDGAPIIRAADFDKVRAELASLMESVAGSQSNYSVRSDTGEYYADQAFELLFGDD